MRTEPPPSEPGANGSIPDATAAAAPPLEPPAPSAGFHGFRVGGPASPSVYEGSPNSGVALLPRLTAPAASTASTSSSDSSGTKSVKAREPKRAGTPARRCRSLSASGSPQSGAAVGTCSSTWRALAIAASGVTSAKAPISPSRRSMRSR